MQRTRFVPYLLTAVVGILAAGGGMWLAKSLFRGSTQAPTTATVVQPPRALPAFELVSDVGAQFTHDDLVGKWSLVFFGFTHCPAICPNTLTVLQQTKTALDDLPASQQPQIVFVSVDPERDTPAKMHEYVQFFGPTLRGVTGTQAGIDTLARALGVPFNRVDLPNGDYTMDHYTGIFLLNPHGEFNALFSAPQTAQGIAADYRVIVKAST